jgi:Leucine-rich repeat (LRR) protein
MSDLPNKTRRTDTEEEEESEQDKIVKHLNELSDGMDADRDDNGNVTYLHVRLLRTLLVPPEIGKLCQLAHLEIHSCLSLRALPPQIGGLRNLEKFTLFDCTNLRSLPKELGMLQKLKCLELLDCCSLTDLPFEHWRMSNLRVLDIQNCDGVTRNLSPQIKALGQLETLKMTRSEVQFLPLEIWQLPSIQELLIHSKTVPSLPKMGNLRDIKRIEIVLFLSFEDLKAERGNIPRLQNIGMLNDLDVYRIEVECNSSTHLPDGIGSLTTLLELRVSGKELINLPASIGDLKNLTDIKIYCCRSLGCIPTEMWKLRKLKTLAICSCGSLTLLPNEIGFLPELQELNISNCCRLERLPPTIGALQRLGSLKLAAMSSLQVIPKEIGMLTNLKELHLKSCPLLAVLPDEIGQLSQLRVLNLWCCGRLERLPPTMGELHNLSSFEMDTCDRLRSLPPEMLMLPNLQTLHLRECPDESRIVDFFMPGFHNLQTSLKRLIVDGVNLGQGDDLSKVWSFILRCPKLASVELNQNDIANLRPLLLTLEEEKGSGKQSQLRSLDLQYNQIHEDPEDLKAFLKTHMQLEYTSDSSFPPEMQYLVDINACGRILLEGGVRPIPLAVWPKVLERAASVLCIHDDTERIASVFFYFLRNGPAFANRCETWK